MSAKSLIAERKCQSLNCAQAGGANCHLNDSMHPYDMTWRKDSLMHSVLTAFTSIAAPCGLCLGLIAWFPFAKNAGIP